jgi:ubiquinone/menaquinone biosynthesis C-methylase UbiE
MASHDTKQSEKEYLRRTAAGAWELYKPFSPPGSQTLDDSTALMLDFAAAIAHLPPRSTDRILDVAAGACWCSDWLQRLNFRTVAVDISHDMLHLGRSRLPQPERAQLVTGDLENLPFANGSFDKAYCLSAIHHVPDIGRAVSEIARVLAPDGAVLFSEPGVGHADKPGSVSAMQDFGVLEQDIVASEFLEACTAAGFADVQIKPMSYVIPAFGLSAADWEAWRRHAGSKRPARAAGTIWRGVLELFGLGKKTVRFEETLAMTLVRLLAGAMHDHPVIVARKSLVEVGTSRYVAALQFLGAPSAAAVGAAIPLAVRVTNTGRTSWPIDPVPGPGYLRLGVQLLDSEQRLIDRDFHREALASPVGPGETREFRFHCRVPDAPGAYYFKLDMVVEGVAWLEPQGSGTAVHAIHVG